MPSYSRAFMQFKESLTMAEELLRIERINYHNPPRQDEQKAVQGLRGGAVVLMVAAFENFLKRAFEEHLSALTAHPIIPFEKLPEKLRVNGIYFTLEHAMKSPRFQERQDRIERLPEIDKACRMLVYQCINPAVFSDTGSNPGSKTVKSMFSNIGIDRIFEIIKDNFESQWQPTGIAHTFISDKLDEIINRRHIVAHTANALNIARSDLNEALRFLKVIASLLDLELKKHIDAIRQ